MKRTESSEIHVGISECLESELKINSVIKINYPLEMQSTVIAISISL